MGEKEMNARVGNGCTGCSPHPHAMNRGTPYSCPYNTRMGGGSHCGCTGRPGVAGNHHHHTAGGAHHYHADNVHGVKAREGAYPSSGDAVCCELTEKLRKLEFGIVDVAHYLNAYPDSDCALAYYHKLIEERSSLLERINEECGPMTLYDNRSKTCWKWVEGPWPWHLDSN